MDGSTWSLSLRGSGAKNTPLGSRLTLYTPNGLPDHSSLCVSTLSIRERSISHQSVHDTPWNSTRGATEGKVCSDDASTKRIKYGTVAAYCWMAAAVSGFLASSVVERTP